MSTYLRLAALAWVMAGAGVLPARAGGGAIGLDQLSEKSRKCIDCHKKENLALYSQWGSSKHFTANVGCYECHAADPKDADAYQHEGETISVIVSPRDCSRCHAREVTDFMGSHHSEAARILGSLDNVLAEVVEGNKGFVTQGFPKGTSAAAANGCWQCHGSVVQVGPNGKLDEATWPNTGIGRINPDGSEGSCAACHSRHTFSVEQARYPDTCGKCHMGPDHPQKEIYEESKHGIAFFANLSRMNLANAKWMVGEDYAAAPTCATCHMSATKKQAGTHDVGTRISWNNRPAFSVRPEVADKKMNLPGQNLPWDARRAGMKDVCLNCHSTKWVENWYVQYDELIKLYNDKYGKPGLALYAAAKPLLKPVEFGNHIDFTWYEIWHHEGRRARHGAAMMGPDYTHWHGTYEVAKHWYSEYIPELEDLAKANLDSADATRKDAAQKLKVLLEQTLESEDHRWYIDKMDPEEKAARVKAAAEFNTRYESK